MYVIYKLYFDNYSDCYVGQTKNLKNRLSSHKSCLNSKQHLKLYDFINDIGWENIKVQILENVDSDELIKVRKRERFFIDLIKPSLNSSLPMRSNDEYFKEKKKEIYEKRNVANLARREDYNKRSLDYYYNNKDKLIKQRKEWRLENKDEIEKKQKTKFICPCGVKLTYACKLPHIETNRHSVNLLKNIKLFNSKLIHKPKRNINIYI